MRTSRLRALLMAPAIVLLAAMPLTPSADADGTPVVDVGATGAPFTGGTANGQVRGYIDAHSHLMSYLGFGGSLMCGETFDPGGPAAALKDCPDHSPNGIPAWFENFTRKGTPIGSHDTTGWPTFKDWPAYDSYTHEQSWYKWIERSWRAGQRVLVNQLVDNRTLCEIYPLKKYPCDEMETIRRQAKATYALQDFIDRENGGAGKGWFRVVTGPQQARRVIEQGKLAVVLGIETSEPFGCREVYGKPRCTKADIDRGLDEVQKLGVSSMFLCHKFDNALCGVRYDSDATGVIMNLGQFVGSGRFWQADHCTAPEHDNPIMPSGRIGDLLAGPLSGLRELGVTVPVYPSAPLCNANGLTGLGAYTLHSMIKRKMIIELDHMSAKAAGQSLDLLEKARYSGVISSHSWSDEHYLSRVYRLGGMVTSYASSAPQFIDGWKQAKAQADPKYLFGYGYGLDANGMGPLPAPRTTAAKDPLKYPFRSPVDPGVTLTRQKTGVRTWDLNTDGVANYGLVPDWIADLRHVGGSGITDDMAKGAEAYLEMWQRAKR
ncbi:Coagulation factor 5/8 type domain-containing protein [Spirillospora sp. NPDC000708]